ncbi:MAG: PD40 domain-containing protein [Planctomycetes bacterium]|nr:PD40 domain-containing protein [Planctomycetota bacterium]
MRATLASVVFVVAAAGCGSEPEPANQEDLAQIDPIAEFEVRYRHWTDLRQHTFGETGEDFDPDVTFDRRWLAFASTRDSANPDIYVKELDSRTAIRLTSHPASDRYPAVSPDGSMVAFASDRNGNWDVFIVPASGPSAVIEVTHGEGDEIAPEWSPNADRLCYSARDVSGVWNLWIYDRTTQSLSNIGPGLFAAWSPDGEWLAFQRPQQVGGNWYALWRVRFDGSEPTQVLSRPEWAAIHPAWSADGTRIAFATVHQSRFSQIFGRLWKADDIWTVRADGTDLTNLTDHPAADWSPSWGADDRIYFTSEMEGRKNIWSVLPRKIEFTLPPGAEAEPSDGGAAPSNP